MNRKKAAFAAGMKQAAEKEPVDPATLPSGGNWSRMAFDGMERRLREANGALERAEEATYQGILEGVVPIIIPADQIIDEVGSDRFDPSFGEETEDYAALVNNIRERGQRTPIRVRPKNPAWRPNPRAPREIGAEIFLLQSGRRRLEACRELGIAPTAFLSFVTEGNARLDDLHERFFENATRKNLSTVEKLYSIGLIAGETPQASQSQIADFLGISLSQVSRGRAVVEYFERLEKDIDLNHATIREVDAALKQYRQGRQTESPAALEKRKQRSRATAQLPFRTRALQNGEAKLRIDGDGNRVLTLRDQRLDDDRIEEILRIVERQ